MEVEFTARQVKIPKALRELAKEGMERIGRLLGRAITVESETDRLRPAASEVERLLAGTALAQSLWNWKPRYSLDQGLEETIAWIREHIGRFRTESYTT